MKKKSIFLSLFVLIVTAYIFGEIELSNGDFVEAYYRGTINEVNIQQEIDTSQRTSTRFLTPVSKLSKYENYLVGQAIRQYDIARGEVYRVHLGKVSSYEMVMIMVKIDSVKHDGSFTFTWWDIGRAYF